VEREPFPRLVTEVFHGLAMLALLFGATGTAVTLGWAFSGPRKDLALRGCIGIGVLLGCLLVWALLTSAALVVSYLWVVQDELQRRETQETEPARSRT